MWDDKHPAAAFGGFGNTPSAGATGGGFMSPGLNESQSVSDRKGGSDAKKNICPVTIGQILKVPHTEDHVIVGSTKMSMVTFCGIVTSVDEASNKLHFKIDDMTGPPLLCQYWQGSTNPGANKVQDIRSVVLENNYVRVIGALRITEDVRFVLAFNVKPITDFNEVTVHMLEVIHSNLALSVVTPEGATGATSEVSSYNETSSTADPSNASIVTTTGNGLNMQQNMVFQAVAAIKTEDGASIDYLCNTLSSLPKPKIREILEFLNNEGHIYTAIDDNHFKTTE